MTFYFQKLLRLLVQENSSSLVSAGNSNYHVLVLARHTLQKWSLCLGESERLVYECNLEPFIVENFVQTVWVSA